MGLTLQFRENFKCFASIRNSCLIEELQAFSEISGVNGVGKYQFLEAIKKGFVEVEIDGEKLDADNNIELFNHENFKLRNEQNLAHDFLENKKEKLP